MSELGTTQFVTYERGDTSLHKSVLGIVEWSDREDRKKTRRLIMKEIGKIVNQMLDEEVTSFSVERLKPEQTT